MTTIRREDTVTGNITVYANIEDAIDQYITDMYESIEDVEGELEDWLNDMQTVFETRHAMEKLEEGDELKAGNFIYTV